MILINKEILNDWYYTKYHRAPLTDFYTENMNCVNKETRNIRKNNL